MRQALTSSQQRCTSQEAPPWSVCSQCSLFQSMWDKQQIAREFCDATTIVHTCNRKGNYYAVQRQQRNIPPVHSRQDPGLSLAQPLADTPAAKSQCGSRAGQETQTWSFLPVRSKRNMLNSTVNSTKHFWPRQGLPHRQSEMINLIFEDGDRSEAFQVTSGVKQGCVLVPALFSIMFKAMPSRAFRNCKLGINIRFKTDGKLFNPNTLSAVTNGERDSSKNQSSRTTVPSTPVMNSSSWTDSQRPMTTASPSNLEYQGHQDDVPAGVQAPGNQ